MVTLDYLFDPEEMTRLQGFEFEKLTGTDLDYHLFCGSIFFRANGVSLDALWKWIPVLDFCVRINEILPKLQEQEQAVLEFTENEATIVFEKHDSSVAIRAEYANAHAHVQLQELQEAVKGFSGKLVRELIERWPILLRTAPFQERLDIIHSSCGESLIP